jgi:hypothetical protein
MGLNLSVIMGVITLRVSHRHPAKQLTQPAVFGWMQDQVPMIGHQHLGVEFDWMLLESFFKKSLQRFVVVVLMKDGLRSIPAIQGMVNPPASSTRFCRGMDATPQIVWPGPQND